ncbi:hypothetical protein OMDBNIEC_00079 [Salmonella phage STP-SP5]|nr:hypothetical protein OMDBNIEC_00079 [Salmonella phage STP-SP5]
MEIPLIVEDGTGVKDANSYISIEQARTFAAMRGITLPSEDEVLKTKIFDAMDFVEGYAQRFKGRKANPQQELQWPRCGVILDGVTLPQSPLPKALINAVCQLTADSSLTGPLNGKTTSYAVKRTKVEGLEIEYATGSTAQAGPAKTYDKAMTFLNPLLNYQMGNRLIR